MNDWQAGDLALCVKGNSDTAETTRLGVTPPRAGAVYNVQAVSIEAFASGEKVALWLENGPNNCCTRQGVRRFDPVWPAVRFVKITPGHKITGSEVDQREQWNVEA